MTSPAAVSPEFDYIQRYLLPAESKSVRYCMQKASEMSEREDFVTRRLFSVPFVIASIALSFFNAISYLLQIPFIILLNVVRFAPLRLVTDPAIDLINVARSLLFVGMGIPLALAGLIFPKDVFSRFAPDAIEAGEERLVHENKNLQKRIQELEVKIAQDKKLIDAQAALIQSNTKPTWWEKVFGAKA